MTPGSAPREPRSGPRSPKTAPRAARSAPGAPKSRPKSASERPWRPTGAHLAPESPPEASRRTFFDLQRDDFPPSRGDFRTISILRKTSAKRSLLPGRLFGRQASAEQADALETLAAQARVATVPTQLSDEYGDGQQVDRWLDR